MTDKPVLPTRKGPWIYRFLVLLFSLLLGLLIYWLLGFVVQDIGTWPGPSYDELVRMRIDPKVLEQQETLQRQVAEVQRQIDDQQARQQLLRDSTSNSQTTMNQLLALQRLSLEKNLTPSPDEQQALAESERLFLDNQRQYQVLSDEVARLHEQHRQLQGQARGLDERLRELRRPVDEEYAALARRHNLLMASLKLSFLVPLLLVAGLLLLRKASSLYAPLLIAFAIAVVVKVFMVMHEYFPARYFKYILILTSLAMAVRILVYLLRLIAHPRRELLLKRYREAYESLHCPICGYPIRRGPLKYMVWTRRSLRRLTTPPAATAEEPYTCPSCATTLFAACESCGGIRPALLPACDKCGALARSAVE